MNFFYVQKSVFINGKKTSNQIIQGLLKFPKFNVIPMEKTICSTFYHCIALHSITVYGTTIHCITVLYYIVSLYYTTLVKCNTLVNCIMLHWFTALLYIDSLYYTTLVHSTTLHCITYYTILFHCILHYIG